MPRTLDHPQIPVFLDRNCQDDAVRPENRAQFFNPDRGFGFIVPDEGGPDAFVHVHDVEAAGMTTLVAGQVLKYNTRTNRSGTGKPVN
jgi:cold shock protein